MTDLRVVLEEVIVDHSNKGTTRVNVLVTDFQITFGPHRGKSGI